MNEEEPDRISKYMCSLHGMIICLVATTAAAAHRSGLLLLRIAAADAAAAMNGRVMLSRHGTYSYGVR